MFWKTIDGINIWKINRKFTKLALSKTKLEENLDNGVVVIPLSPKKTKELTNTVIKREIEDSIRNSEGFENFRLCLLEDCTPIYKEKLTLNGVSRWVEVPLS